MTARSEKLGVDGGELDAADGVWEKESDGAADLGHPSPIPSTGWERTTRWSFFPKRWCAAGSRTAASGGTCSARVSVVLGKRQREEGGGDDQKDEELTLDA